MTNVMACCFVTCIKRAGFCNHDACWKLPFWESIIIMSVRSTALLPTHDHDDAFSPSAWFSNLLSAVCDLGGSISRNLFASLVRFRYVPPTSDQIQLTCHRELAHYLHDGMTPLIRADCMWNTGIRCKSKIWNTWCELGSAWTHPDIRNIWWKILTLSGKLIMPDFFRFVIAGSPFMSSTSHSESRDAIHQQWFI